ncbi:MAG TPA: hypothetical protein EYN66_08645 [Myxococcales bacterium]|nr:hypothetical protein [Myxococcales bacterium]
MRHWILCFFAGVLFLACSSEESPNNEECGPGTGVECQTPQQDAETPTPDTSLTDTGQAGADSQGPSPDTQIQSPVSNIPPPELISCVYPTKQLAEGNSGVDVGNILPSAMSWTGYPSQSNELGTVKVSDYYDCDGTKGYDVLLFDTSQFG